MPPVRVLVVDDSSVIRKVLTHALASNPDIEVAGTAPSGPIALAKIPQLNPDVVTLDVEMPGLNGIQTLAEIRKVYPKLPVIMFSSLTERGASATLEALAMGASDYVTKPSAENLDRARELIRKELVTKILFFARRRIAATPASAVKATPKPRLGGQRIDVLAIGSSTGGPNALLDLLPRLPADLPVPVVLVQHMPPLFTRFLAERLDSRSPLCVREAERGAALKPGQVWVAPGDYHMTVERKPSSVVLSLNQGPPENSCRPAVDVLFRSVATAYGANVLAVVLTGMGYDGARGAQAIREAGGEIFVQDESSSVVWGMPGAVVAAGAADKICPLSAIASEIAGRIALGQASQSRAAAP